MLARLKRGGVLAGNCCPLELSGVFGFSGNNSKHMAPPP